MNLNKKFIQKTASLKTPITVYDLSIVDHNVKRLREALSGVDLYYSLKCNPLDFIVERLIENGVGFEVASLAEVKQVVDAGTQKKKIMCLHPIKSIELLQHLIKEDIDIVAIDSYEEADKIRKHSPKLKLLARIDVPNDDSRWDLSGKFGIGLNDFNHFCKYLRKNKLELYGTTIHVGSQCETTTAWSSAIEICREAWDIAAKHGFQLKVLSLGGGLPAQYHQGAPSLDSICSVISIEISRLFKQAYPDVSVTIEPGRAIIAEASITITEVFGTATRGKENWAYIETGTHNGLMEVFETKDPHFYSVMTEKITNEKKIKYNIGGPSCMTIDTVFRGIELPRLDLGDRLYIINTGAYSVTCSAPFNGFAVPTPIILDEL